MQSTWVHPNLDWSNHGSSTKTDPWALSHEYALSTPEYCPQTDKQANKQTKTSCWGWITHAQGLFLALWFLENPIVSPRIQTRVLIPEQYKLVPYSCTFSLAPGKKMDLWKETADISKVKEAGDILEALYFSEHLTWACQAHLKNWNIRSLNCHIW